MKLRNLLIAAAGLAVVAGAATTASAYEHTWQRHPGYNRWQDNHLYRTRLNHRLTYLSRSIAEERREGDINGAQAYRLQHRIHGIGMRERRLGWNHSSHIGLAGQAQLNRDVNSVSRSTPR